MQSALSGKDSKSYASTFPQQGTPHPSVYCLFKRSIDIVGSLIGLVFFGLIFFPVALAIRLDSPGPILYSQKRYGLMGNPFYLYKFRSMVQNADELKAQIKNEAKGLIFKNKNDPRITWVGRFLRKTSLDELPQFWNVLKGEMSLVGTRPPTFDEVIQYSSHHWQRLNVKPGLTGEWQVSGRSLVKDFEDIVQLDLLYQAQWHPFYDLFLICKTVLVLLTKRSGAC
ncbi:sugar transferase [Phormidium sp. CLA17]|nr:sugar transferase [Leptolyngbya sp. Cla-17]